jgi:hypothetical protein
MDGRRVTLTHGTTLRFGSLGFIYTGPVESVTWRTFTQSPRPNVLTGAAGCEAFVQGFLDDVIIGMLGPNPMQERFRLVAYYLTDLAFQASGDEPLGWGVHGAVHRNVPPGQPGLLDNSVTAYVDSLRTTGAAPGSVTTRRARTTRRCDPTRECNVCVASASSSSELEPAPRHRNADAQRRAQLDELAEARRQLNEELALIHQELGMDAEPRDRRPVQDDPVQGEPREGNDDRRERRPAADQPRRADRRATTTDAPTRARTSTPTSTLTLCHFSGMHLRTLPQRQCCCAAARSPRPPRSDGCATS